MTDQHAGESDKLEFVREFGNRVQESRLADLRVVYRITGGMPSERRDEKLTLHGDGQVDARVSDALQPTPMREASLKLDQAEAGVLLRELSSALGKLAEQSDVGFPPDSLVGSITAEIDGKTVTFYFLPDEEERARHGKELPPEATRALERFQGLSRRLFARSEER